MNSTPDAPELPPLPRPCFHIEWDDLGFGKVVDMPSSTSVPGWSERGMREALAARQPEPVAPSAHECPPSLALRAWNALSEVDYEFDPPQRILDLMYELQLVAQGRTQPPADLKDARIWDLLAKLETYHKDGRCMLGVFGYPGFFETGDSAIRAAMLSSAPTGEKP